MRSITTSTAKSKNLSELTYKIGKLSGTNCKTAWKAVRQFEQGNKNNHIKQKTCHSEWKTASKQKQTRKA
jgi:hypothetical protein